MNFNIEDFGEFVENSSDESDEEEGGYLFISTQQGVGYKMEGDPDEGHEILITAHLLSSPEKQIGEAELASPDMDGEIYLDSIDVDENFRRKGIGTVLLYLAIEKAGMTRVYCSTNMRRRNGKYLMPDGEELVASCIRKGIITAGMCYRNKSDVIKEALREVSSKAIATKPQTRSQTPS